MCAPYVDSEQGVKLEQAVATTAEQFLQRGRLSQTAHTDTRSSHVAQECSCHVGGLGDY